jgi:2-polyprenylphenol 6-hydroxylase
MMANKVSKENVTYDVVVVGAGLVGLATVVALAQQGKRVVLVDATQYDGAQTEAWDTRIYALTPATEHWLQDLGVWSQVNQARVNGVETMSLWGPESSDALNLSAEDANCSKLACIVENKNLMQALWQKLKVLDAQIIIGSPCLHVVSSEEAITLHLENGAVISAKLLVAADGAHSFVRQQLAIPTKVKSFNQLALVANYLAEQDHNNIARQWFSRHATLALLPLPAHHVSMVWSLPRELAQTLLGLTADALAERVQTESKGILGQLKPVSCTLSFELRQVTASKAIANRVVLVGDAAHQVHPMAGQGANLGFRDVISLDKLIADSHQLQDIGEESFLRRYERTRKADVLSMNALTSGLDSWFSFESDAIRGITVLGMKQLEKHVSIKKFLIKQAIA